MTYILNSLFEDPTIAKNPVVEDEQFGKMLWEHTDQDPELRAECEIKTKQLLESCQKSCEKHTAEGEDQKERNARRVGSTVFRTAPENYKA
jgi:hypothetical protein